MDYLSWIRSKVGNKTILLVYATALIRDDRGRVLFQRRGDFSVWGLPGGIMEPGETILETLRREASEETGFHVEAERFVGLYSSPDYAIRYPNGDQVQQVTACFECRVRNGNGRPDGVESLDQEFLPSVKAPKLFPWYRQMLRDSVERGPTRYEGGRSLGENPYPGGVIGWLRSHVGHEPILMPCAAAVILDDRRRVLLIRRADSGQWALPAGGMEVGERIDRTVIREVREETGLDVEPRRLTGFYTGPDHRSIYPNGDQVWLAVACFACDVVGGQLDADGIESLEAAFFELDALPLDTPPWGRMNRQRISDALQGRPEAFAR